LEVERAIARQDAAEDEAKKARQEAEFSRTEAVRLEKALVKAEERASFEGVDQSDVAIELSYELAAAEKALRGKEAELDKAELNESESRKAATLKEVEAERANARQKAAEEDLEALKAEMRILEKKAAGGVKTRDITLRDHPLSVFEGNFDPLDAAFEDSARDPLDAAFEATQDDEDDDDDDEESEEKDALSPLSPENAFRKGQSKKNDAENDAEEEEEGGGAAAMYRRFARDAKAHGRAVSGGLDPNEKDEGSMLLARAGAALQQKEDAVVLATEGEAAALKSLAGKEVEICRELWRGRRLTLTLTLTLIGGRSRESCGEERGS